MLTVFTLSIPLSYFDYFGHVHPSLSKGWHLILGLCGRLRCEIQPMQNNSLESLHGLLPWFCWTQLRCKLYQIVLYLHMLYILGNNCQPKKNDCTNHKGGLMVRKFHEINKINVIIVCQYVTSNTLKDSTGDLFAISSPAGRPAVSRSAGRPLPCVPAGRPVPCSPAGRPNWLAGWLVDCFGL